jgi:hypothetical protein
MEQRGPSMQLRYGMKNEGAVHVRPYLSWSVHNEAGEEIASMKRYEATVLLPFANLDEQFALQQLPPGKYKVIASADFQDQGPVQSMTRTVEIAPSSATPTVAGLR